MCIVQDKIKPKWYSATRAEGNNGVAFRNSESFVRLKSETSGHTSRECETGGRCAARGVVTRSINKEPRKGK